MKIAVTGASGHIGNVVCRQLLEEGYNVNALYNKDQRSLEDLNINLFQGSVLNKSDLEHLIDGVDVVIHCAAIISIDGDPQGIVFKTNTEGPKNILDVSIQKGVKKIIHISSVHAVTEIPHSVPYDECRPYKNMGSSAYDYSKAQGEQILLHGSKNNPIEVIILRPSCVIGPYDFKPSKMGSALLDFYNGKVPFIPEGGYNLVDIRDVASSILNAIEHGKDGEIYLLSGKYYDFKELSEAIRKVTGKKTPNLVIPHWLMIGILPFVSLHAKITKSAPSFTKESIEAIRNGHPNMNHTKARAVLDHNPRPLEETLRDFFDWQIENEVISAS